MNQSSNLLNFGPLSPRYLGTQPIGGAQIGVYEFAFKRWTGEPPPKHRSTYKCVYYEGDLAPYPEFAVCRGLRDGGATQALWAESKDCVRAVWRGGKESDQMRDLAPPPVVTILEEIWTRMGRPKHGPGVWEIVAWWEDPFRIHFCEVKGPGDRLNHNQILWLQAGLEFLSPTNFSLLKYTFVD